MGAKLIDYAIEKLRKATQSHKERIGIRNRTIAFIQSRDTDIRQVKDSMYTGVFGTKGMRILDNEFGPCITEQKEVCNIGVRTVCLSVPDEEL